MRIEEDLAHSKWEEVVGDRKGERRSLQEGDRERGVDKYIVIC